MWLGSVHAGSNGRIFSASRIALALAAPVACDTPNALSISAVFTCGDRPLSSRKFT